MNIRGSYRFMQNDPVLYESDNLITLQGKEFFMNRCVNNEFGVIDTINLG